MTGAQDGHLSSRHSSAVLSGSGRRVDGDDDDHDVELHVGLGCRLTAYQGQTVTNAKAWFNDVADFTVVASTLRNRKAH